MTLLFRQFQLDCLSQFSYLVGDSRSGHAAVIDPRRDVDLYLRAAADIGLSIDWVITTHYHADFVGGHLELADATGARIAVGAAATPAYPVRRLLDGERIELGDVSLEVWLTPGHTPESMCVLVHHDADGGSPWGVLTGDTLLIGDVGRPDLAVSGGWTARALAGSLFTSIDRLRQLPRDTRVFPAHGAGSACSRTCSDATVSTIGEEFSSNPLLHLDDPDDFVAAVTAGQAPPPAYFSRAATLNAAARPLLAPNRPTSALELEAVLGAVDSHAEVLDCRSPERFRALHLTGSINVGLHGRFAEHAGSVLRLDAPVILAGDPDGCEEAQLRLARIGVDHVAGWLVDVESTLTTRPDIARSAPASSLDDIQSAGAQLLDVRQPSETASGTIAGAVKIPLAQLHDRLEDFDGRTHIAVYCASGYRSSIAASFLRARSDLTVSELAGGYDDWRGRGRSESSS